MCTACGGTTGAVIDDAEAFCELTLEIEQLSDDADEQPLTPAAEQLVRERVSELRDSIPDDYVDDFRLRYWPVTDVSGLDTSGVSAQRAFDRMRALFEQTCGSE